MGVVYCMSVSAYVHLREGKKERKKIVTYSYAVENYKAMFASKSL
jgi:hypothetical protein